MDRTAYKNRHIKEHYDRINFVILQKELISDPSYFSRKASSFTGSLPVILMILSDYFHRRLTIRGICEKYLVNVPLIYRLKKGFLFHKKQWLGALLDMELCVPGFVEQLQTESYFRFRDAFLRLTTYSFLQI